MMSDKKQISVDKKEESPAKAMFGLFVYIVGVIGVALLLNAFVIQKVKVNGDSMMDTLHDKEQLIIEKVSYRFHDPERFDIIVFEPYSNNEKTLYIKRIIGMPGDKVQIIDGMIYINDTILEETYGNAVMRSGGIAENPITLGEGEYFVLGDNRNGSKDSRDGTVGIVTRGRIIGRAFVRIWPLNKLGGID